MRVVVTRAAEDSTTLSSKLRAAGFEVVEVPTIRIADARDGGAALRDALADPAQFEWVVVTSGHGAARVAEALGDRRAEVKVAAIGPATASTAHELGLCVALVPPRFVAEALLEVFPAPSAANDRVLVAQADLARPTLVEGLRAQGWRVTAVEAYRTEAADVAPAAAVAVATADAVAFTSASTVDNFVNALGLDHVPPVAACIGPVTEAAARRHGISGIVVAMTHTLDGLVSVLAEVPE